MILSEQAGITVEVADQATFMGEGQLQRMLITDTLKIYRVTFEAGARTNLNNS